MLSMKEGDIFLQLLEVTLTMCWPSHRCLWRHFSQFLAVGGELEAHCIQISQKTCSTSSRAPSLPPPAPSLPLPRALRVVVLGGPG